MRRCSIKLLVIFLSFSVICSLFPKNIVFADSIASGVCGDNLTWTLDNNSTLSITGSGDMYDWDFYYDSATDTDILTTPWRDYRNNIRTVIISENTSSIGDYAFYECCNLTSVTIPNHIASIGVQAFGECINLKDINIPNSVTEIKMSAFWNCSGLTSISIPNSVTAIGESAFYHCSGLTSFSFPESITVISDGILEQCTGLKYINIPNTVTRIGRCAFYECSSLESITLPEGITSVNEMTFRECSSLKSIDIPDSVRVIDYAAFYDCTNLTSVSYHSGVQLRNYAFSGCHNAVFHIRQSINYSTNDHGTVKIKKSAYIGEIVDIDLFPEDGYIVDKVLLIDSNFNETEISPDTNGNYRFVMPSEIITVASFFKKIESPVFSGHGLVLADQIGVKFRVKFPENFDANNCYVSFSSSDGRKATVTYSESQQIEGTRDRYFIFGINAIELADTITATIYYGDGQTKINTYSAMEYIEYIKLNYNSYPNGEKLLSLVNALQDYGFYMQASGWSDGGSHSAITSPSIVLDNDAVTAAINDVNEFEMITNIGSSGIDSNVKVSLTLNSQTELKVSVKTSPEAQIVSTGYTERQINGETYYQFSVKGIGPKNLDYMYSFTIDTDKGTATIQVSAMYYLKAMINSGMLDNNQLRALIAYYNYYFAAENY